MSVYLRISLCSSGRDLPARADPLPPDATRRATPTLPGRQMIFKVVFSAALALVECVFVSQGAARPVRCGVRPLRGAARERSGSSRTHHAANSP